MLPVIYKLDKERTLKLNFKAIAAAERKIGLQISKWDVAALTFDQVATILTEAMKAEEKDITSDKVIELIEEYSTYVDAFSKAYECLYSSGLLKVGTKNNETLGESQPEPAKKETAGTGN